MRDVLFDVPVLKVTRVHEGQALGGVYLKSYDLSFKLYVE